MIELYCGKYIGIVDGHEYSQVIFTGVRDCSVRDVSKIEGEVKLLSQIYCIYLSWR